MDCYTLIILASLAMVTSGWSFPFYPVYPRRLPPIRITRFAPPPHIHRIPIRVQPLIRQQDKPKPERPKHDYNYNEDHRNYEGDHNQNDDHNHKDDRIQNDDHNHKNDYNHQNDNKGNGAIIGPVHTFVKTDKNANYKWGVRHHVPNKRTP